MIYSQAYPISSYLETDEADKRSVYPVNLTCGCCFFGQTSACERVSGQNVGKGVYFCEFGAF